MRKKIKKELSELRALEFGQLSLRELQRMQSHLMATIGFFQHERLVHLIVTVAVAVMTVVMFGVMLISPSVSVCVLTVLLLFLLVPYLYHYYVLENGVQELYEWYERCEESLDKWGEG